jgi:hypothetical protein
MHQLIEESFYSYHLAKLNKLLGYIDQYSSFQTHKVIVCVCNLINCGFEWAEIDSKLQSLNTLTFVLDIVNFFYMLFLVVLWFSLRFYPRYQQSLFVSAQGNRKLLSSEVGKKSILKVLIWDIFICDPDFLYLGTNISFAFFSVIFQNSSLKFFQLVNFVVLSNNLRRLLKFIGRHWLEIFLLTVMLCILLSASVALAYDYFNKFPIVCHYF